MYLLALMYIYIYMYNYILCIYIYEQNNAPIYQCMNLYEEVCNAPWHSFPGGFRKPLVEVPGRPGQDSHPGLRQLSLGFVPQCLVALRG